MGLDFVELIFQVLGRGVCWAARLLFGKRFQLSDGGYEVIGFAFVILLIIFILLIVGAINV